MSSGSGLVQNSRVYVSFLEGAREINRALRAQFRGHRDDPDTRRTHYLEGRYENTFVNAHKVPAAEAVLATAAACAGEILTGDNGPLKYGFWFNEMAPGQRTLSHSHDIHDELLSGVYYVHVPPDSGDLVLLERYTRTVVTPREGMFVFFAPELMHEVSENRSRETRLSLAMNFGRGEPGQRMQSFTPG